MRVLFIGGTGSISSACAALAVARGVELHRLTRGGSARAVPAGARVLRADVRDPAAARAALGDLAFAAVVDWIAVTPEHVEADLALFRGRTRQLVFISSASAYQTPPSHLPVTESTPLANPYWQYSRDKIACEALLTRAWRDEGVPITIVRPSHTYDERTVPIDGGWTVVERMRRGQPVVVHGDGTSLWVLTHHRDFARAFVPLLGHDGAIGHAVHITSDELLSWNQIHALFARAVGAPPPRLVHVPSDVIARHDAEWGASLLGDKAHSMIFDNAKIKRLVPGWTATIPFVRGVEEIAAWHLADETRQAGDPRVDGLLERLVAVGGCGL